ncbi:MAG: TlpA family protein disulfide reductase [Candidatus Bipolaricaulota bacterium]|nr:MAG: TlpA family protein disulfide reductase [Candidatus Bipolaricaulota bacterium]
MRTFLILAVAAVVGVLVVSQASYLLSLSQKQRVIATSSFPIVGEAAPSFDLPTLDGGRLRLADYSGRPVILYFWTTWCSICKREMPLLIEYHNTSAGPVPIVSICSGRNVETAEEIVTQFGIPFPVGYDDDKRIAKQYQPQEEGVSRQITAFPFAVVVDADGRVIYALAGRFVTVDGLLETLDRLELLDEETSPVEGDA